MADLPAREKDPQSYSEEQTRPASFQAFIPPSIILTFSKPKSFKMPAPMAAWPPRAHVTITGSDFG